MAPKIDTSRLRDIHILVIDDDRRLAQLLESVLRALGFTRITLCFDGVEAWKLLRDNPYDLLICDWVMQQLDGIELIHRLRHDETSVNRLMPILMLSGHSDRDMVEKARDAGITEYLTKPFTASSLCGRISHIIDHPREFVASRQYAGHSRRRKTVQVENDRRKPRA